MRIIYHHPGKINHNGKSGSQVRPYKILRAFRDSGITVAEVTGSASERLQAMAAVKQQIDQGTHFDFVYSENRTIPFALTEDHHLPLHPLMDHKFLHFCARNGIPVSLFYRDAYWRDRSYKSMLPLWGRIITIPLYWFDWLLHARYVNTLYIPSMKMAEILPTYRGKMKLKALPPGADYIEGIQDKKLEPGTLRMLYVGGVEPPTYDLTALLQATDLSPSTRLTICCRQNEWKKQRQYYEKFLSDRVNIVHLSGDELAELYATSDVHAIIRYPTKYLDFAVPVKVFESISHQTPIIITPGTEAARIVAFHGLGWVCNLDQIPALLELLAKNREEIDVVHKHMKAEISNLTWYARVRQIAHDLLKTDL